jgi:hypothetical protein
MTASCSPVPPHSVKSVFTAELYALCRIPLFTPRAPRQHLVYTLPVRCAVCHCLLPWPTSRCRNLDSSVPPSQVRKVCSVLLGAWTLRFVWQRDRLSAAMFAQSLIAVACPCGKTNIVMLRERSCVCETIRAAVVLSPESSGWRKIARSRLRNGHTRLSRGHLLRGPGAWLYKAVSGLLWHAAWWSAHVMPKHTYVSSRRAIRRAW